MGRTQPVKALGSITCGWFPQLARRNALHPSKSNFCVPAKSALSNGVACAIASGSALHPPRKERPFNLLMGAYSTCRRSSAGECGRTSAAQGVLLSAFSRARLRDLAMFFSILRGIGRPSRVDGAIGFAYSSSEYPLHRDVALQRGSTWGFPRMQAVSFQLATGRIREPAT